MRGNEPAYPATFEQHVKGIGYSGMTKREYFAAAAMQAVIHSYSADGTYSPNEAARIAIEHADALLAALKGGEDGK